MFAEYSYFRAEGASLTAIETLQEAKDEVDTLGQTLCACFGADNISGWIDGQTGRYAINHFRFGAPGAPPAGWTETSFVNKAKSTSDTRYALPAPGSPDHFHMLNFAGLMERAAKKTRLENVFGSGEMPLRDMAAGARPSANFVKYKTVNDPSGTPDRPSGALRHDGGLVFSVTSGPWQSADPLACMKLEGTYYIRVPNIAGTEKPAFTPPDAVPIDYGDMLALDGREQMARFNKLRGSSFQGYD